MKFVMKDEIAACVELDSQVLQSECLNRALREFHQLSDLNFCPGHMCKFCIVVYCGISL